MYVALLADIHANLPAFEVVLNDLAQYSPEAVVIAGDLLGYYCDADEVIKKICVSKLPLLVICGNHDVPIVNGNISKDLAYGHILKHNLDHLSCDSLRYLKSLKAKINFEINGLRFRVYHGTPNNPLNGRLYPDTNPDPKWFDAETDVIVLGHTHYPFVWRGPDSTITINPGSVGQPRDGIPAPSWALLNTQTMNISFRRIDYDRFSYSQKLDDLDWDERAIKALFKNKRGPMDE